MADERPAAAGQADVRPDFLTGRRNRFVWLNFCPFCGVKLPRGHA